MLNVAHLCSLVSVGCLGAVCCVGLAPLLPSVLRAVVLPAPAHPTPSAADEAFELLLEVTGAAGAEDMAAGAPGVNVQHAGAQALGENCWRGWHDALRQLWQ